MNTSARYLLTGKEAKELDLHAIQVVGFPGIVLMERAALAFTKVICQHIENHMRILVLCGSGNNAGDGLAIARMLKQQNYDVAIALLADTDTMSEDAKVQLQLAAACQIPAISNEYLIENSFDVIVDAMFGVGLSRNITGIYKEIIHKVNQMKAQVFAVDIPSGINATTGKIMGDAIQADVTITFGTNKLGLVLYPGKLYAGEIIVADIGYPQVSYDSLESPYFYYEPEDLPDLLPCRVPYGHKGTFGQVLIIGGCESMAGAPVFSAKAAYQMGAGIVRVLSTSHNRDVILQEVPEALFDTYEKDSAVDYEQISQYLLAADVIVLGPGLGTSKRAKEIVDYVIKQSGTTPVLLDGDGITLADQVQLREKDNLIVTPHPKEFSRLANISVTDLKEDFLSNVVSYAEKLSCIFVGKDARTIVSDSQNCYVNVSGNDGMATAGSGDVLTGIVAALVAQKKDLFQASTVGVFIHGLCGDFQKQAFNSYSVTASGLIESIKYVLKTDREVL